MSLVIQAQKQPLAVQLETYISQLPAGVQVNMQVESPEGDVAASRGAEEAVPSASVIKIPILVELMEQVHSGKMHLEDRYTLLAADKTGGTGVIAAYADGTQLTLRELARLMMVVSDNTATNVLIRKIGREKVNERMKLLGLPGLQLNRIMMDTAAVARGINNYLTAKEINALLRLIYQKKLASPALCELMQTFLGQNEDKTTLPRFIPETTKIAHKTGVLAYVRGDAGIVFTPKPFIISVFVRGISTDKAEEIIGKIGEICYQFFNKTTKPE
ncbi:MAG: serine hydrolase [Spirosomataceae bacterium]